MNRILSTDIFRFLAVVAVISLHTNPFYGQISDGVYSPYQNNEIYNYVFIIINGLARFCIPFFFVISGYFWGTKVRTADSPIPSALKMGKRLVIIYLAWSFIYLLPYNVGAFYCCGEIGPIKDAYLTITNLIQHPHILLYRGPKPHLWFLAGLIFSLGICTIFIQYKWIKSLIVFSLLLYLTGVLSKAYANTPIGIDIDFNTRNGPFFGTLSFASGYLLSKFKPNTTWLTYGFLIFSLGCVLHFSEIYILWKMYDTSPMQEFVLGTFLMGMGVAMASLSNHPVFQSRMLGKVGQMTLGVYAIHIIYVDIFKAIDQNVYSPFWEAGYLILVLVFSVLTSLILSKNQITKKIVV